MSGDDHDSGEQGARDQVAEMLGRHPAEFLTMFMCGSRCEHVWDGPEVAWGNGASITCSKCGALAGDEAMWG